MPDNLTQEETLQLCNLTSCGMKLADAKKRVLRGRKEITSPGAASKAPTAAERKVALALEIEELGHDAPAKGESLAKFEEALAAAQEAAEGDEGDEGDEGETGEGKDLM